MKPLFKGLIVAAVHIAIVSSLGAKMLYDRSTRPRVWARAVPYDPDLPIRGRYVSLQLEVYAPDIPPQKNPGILNWIAVLLVKENDRLVARRDPLAEPEDVYRGDRDTISFRNFAGEEGRAVLTRPVLFFIPEHIDDPSRRAAGEELWVEVTLPKKGPPRPIRLAVKKQDGTFTPLQIN